VLIAGAMDWGCDAAAAVDPVGALEFRNGKGTLTGNPDAIDAGSLV